MSINTTTECTIEHAELYIRLGKAMRKMGRLMQTLNRKDEWNDAQRNRWSFLKAKDELIRDHLRRNELHRAVGQAEFAAKHTTLITRPGIRTITLDS